MLERVFNTEKLHLKEFLTDANVFERYSKTYKQGKDTMHPFCYQQLHQRELPPEPRRHEDLNDHVLGEEFKKAELDHLRSHAQIQTWTEVSKTDPAVKDHQMLDCMWVYVYKFDKHGRLAKCKARLVVRGDQQAKSTIGDTYAATLAAR
jgi:hypothetical protein